MEERKSCFKTSESKILPAHCSFSVDKNDNCESNTAFQTEVLKFRFLLLFLERLSDIGFCSLSRTNQAFLHPPSCIWDCSVCHYTVKQREGLTAFLQNFIVGLETISLSLLNPSWSQSWLLLAFRFWSSWIERGNHRKGRGAVFRVSFLLYADDVVLLASSSHDF